MVEGVEDVVVRESGGRRLSDFFMKVWSLNDDDEVKKFFILSEMFWDVF